MKAILGILLCYVFLSSQCYAIKGGPDYGGNGVSTTGTYSGILFPSAEQPNRAPTTAKNSLGIFSLTLPSSGVGSGTAFIFVAGLTYTGTVQALADPDNANLYGIINTTYSFSSTDSDSSGITTTTTILAIASGQITGKIINNPVPFSSAPERLTGSAKVGFVDGIDSINGNVDYDVIGFRQFAL